MDGWVITGIILLIIVFLILPIILVITVDSINLWWYSIIGVERENVKREIFKNNKSHVEGKIQDLLKYKLEYDRAKDYDEKKTIAFMIQHNFANFNLLKIENKDLRDFLSQILKGEID